MSPLRKRMMEELQLRNLSPITAGTYIRAVERFARYFDQSPARFGSEQVRQYLLHLLQEKNVVANTLLVNRSALRFLYVVILKQKWFDEEIARPKRRPTLPGILSAEEVTRILDHTHNLKHWTILATFYATALRANELKHLKVSDIDSQRMVLHVRHGKGGIPLPPSREDLDRTFSLLCQRSVTRCSRANVSRQALMPVRLCCRVFRAPYG